MKINVPIINRPFITIALIAGVIGFLIGRISMIPLAQKIPVESEQEENHLANMLLATEDYYVCPMHPKIISDSPGNCPICGMSLIKHKHFSSKVNSGYPAIKIQPLVVHNLGIKTAQVITGDLHHNIETIGKITRVDLTARRIITPPVGGIITYIVNKYDGDEVNAGELLFSITSEELLAQQREFQKLFLAGDSKVPLKITQLLNSGLSKQQIHKLQAGEPPEFSINVYAKEPGYIFSRRGERGESIPSGYTVFNIGSDYRVVEVTAEIFERQWNWVKEGQKASITVRGLPGVIFPGKVVRVEPPVGYTTRSLEVALKFKTNHPGLSQSTFAHVSIMGKIKYHVLLVPRNAVIQTAQGARVVVLRSDGLYQPVRVTLGEQSDEQIEIRSGLKEGDTIISSGQFLIDSESNLQSALLRMDAGSNSYFSQKPE